MIYGDYFLFSFILFLRWSSDFKIRYQEEIYPFWKKISVMVFFHKKLVSK